MVTNVQITLTLNHLAAVSDVRKYKTWFAPSTIFFDGLVLTDITRHCPGADYIKPSKLEVYDYVLLWTKMCL